MSDNDPARAYEVLRIETAAMLGLDLATLSPQDGLRLDLTSLLRLSLDSLQGIALSGQEVDLARLQSCFSMLSKLLPAAVAGPQMRESLAARSRLAQLINDIAEVEETDRNERIAELEEIIAEKNSTILALGGVVANAASSATPEQPPAPPPAETSPPTATSSQPPLPPRSPNNQPPAAYLAKRDEPWRPFVGGGGISTPGVPPGSDRSPRTW